jgi:site-specific DNA-cytosine methylase
MRADDAPCFTVTTGSGGKQPYRAWLALGRVVAMTPRAIARFQSFPDTYVLPERKGDALKVLGNAVPPLLMQRLGENW